MYFSPRDPCSELGGEPVSASGAGLGKIGSLTAFKLFEVYMFAWSKWGFPRIGVALNHPF